MFTERWVRLDLKRRRSAIRALAWSCRGYLVATLGLWLVVATLGDRWWPATLFLYGPRWLWALPLAVLVPAAVAARRWDLLWQLGCAAVVVAIPVMGMCIPWRSWLDRRPSQFAVRVLSLNTQGGGIDTHRLAALIGEATPDVVALQEQSDFPEAARDWRADWHVSTSDGLCVGSRYPIESPKQMANVVPGVDGAVSRVDLVTPAGRVAFYNLHLETPREGLAAVVDRRLGALAGVPEFEEVTARRDAESQVMSDWIAPSDGGAVLLAGDFNMPAESVIFRRLWSRYTDAFLAAGLGFGHTKFTRWFGVRIDHILAGPGWRIRRCWVGPDVGSDHRPLIADIDWVGGVE